VPEPLDVAALTRAVAATALDVGAARAALKEAAERIDLAYLSGVPIPALLAARAAVVDALITRVWTGLGLDGTGRALVAVGGYGRTELHPCSDIDIAILGRRTPTGAAKDRLQSFLTLLWDLGLSIGHSVRTVGQCQAAARADLTVATNLMEARLVCGDAALFESMRRATGPDRIWPVARFFVAKRDEQTARHRRFHDTAQNLEPHVKEGPGGLRDIQIIAWVARRHFGDGRLESLVTHGFLTRAECESLHRAQLLLWRVRYCLHRIAGRREDRLLFDYQRRVAAEFGYRDRDRPNQGIEQFMKLYYRNANEVSRLSELLLELFHEAFLDRNRKVRITELNKRFRIRNDYIEAAYPQVFARYPFALLELFLLMQQRSDSVKGVRASTIRLVRDHRHLIDAKFRNDLRARSLFLEILRQPRRVGFEISRMHRYGVLGAYLPVFEAVAGLMQFDLFHVYTVDEHTLAVVRNMRAYWYPPGEDMPVARMVADQIPKPELLYIAGLFHDIAKGRGGDHSELGEQEAVHFCALHQLPVWDTHLVAWLVRHHLVMSMTAQRKDISDPKVVNDFAGFVGDATRLNYLYLLTCADITGTNPKLWTSWKDSLLRELYFSALRALRRGLENPIGRAERIAEARAEVLTALAQTRLDRTAVEQFWAGLDAEYFLRHSAEEILWHAENILACPEERLPLVLVREDTGRGGTAIFVYTRDRDYLFAIMTRTLDQLGLNILDARIITSRTGYTLDTYFVLEADTGETISDAKRTHEIVRGLTKALTETQGKGPVEVSRRADRKLQHFRFPTEVRFDQDEANRRTVMEVITSDRPGVLARIGMALQFCGVRLQNARIATFGERVEDIFYVTGRDNAPITDPIKFECLANTIVEALDAHDRAGQ
jgi:[protein-PII] uridylyltransferase